MLGKLLLGGLAAFGLFKGAEWWKVHKSQHALNGGHDYIAIFDFTGNPQEPIAPSTVQSNLDTAHPGQFTVIGCDTDLKNKQLKVTVEAMTDEYVSGDELATAVAGVPGQPSAMYATAAMPGYGNLTMASITDAGAVSSQGGGAVPFSPAG